MIGQRQPGNSFHLHKTRATWSSSSSGFPYPPVLRQAPLPNKVSCLVSSCVSLDNSFLSVRQEPTLRPWKGSHFLKHVQCAGERNQETERQTETRPTGNLAFDPLPHAHHSPCLPTYPPIFTHLVFITMAKACGGTRTRKSIYQDVTKATENPLSHYTLY